MHGESSVHQQVEPRELVPVPLASEGVRPLDVAGLVGGAGLAHVQGRLVVVHHAAADQGAGDGGADLGQLVGDVGGGDVEAAGVVVAATGVAALLAAVSADTPSPLLATPTGTTGAAAEHSALSAVIPLL